MISSSYLVCLVVKWGWYGGDTVVILGWKKNAEYFIFFLWEGEKRSFWRGRHTLFW